jgi:hypothetical protein
VAALLLLAGCTTKSSDSTSTAAPIKIKIADSAAGHTDITGTWARCEYSSTSGVDNGETNVYTGNKIVITSYTYTSADGSCGTGEAVDSSGNQSNGTLTGTVDKDALMTGWLDKNTGQLTAAPAATGGGNLSATPSASLISFSGTMNGSAASGQGAMFVDVSGTAWRLYSDSGASSACPLDAQGYPACLGPLDPLIFAASPGAAAAAVAATPLMVADSAVGHQDVTGVWSECHTSTVDKKQTHTFAGSVVTVASYAYTSTNATCSTGETVDSTGANFTLTMIVARDGAMTGWLNGAGALTSAPAATTGGSLFATPTASLNTYFGMIGGSLTQGKGALFLDVSGTPWKMYTDDEKPACDFDPMTGYPQCLSAVDPLLKQWPAVLGASPA